ncbi:hypothetical protein Thein_1109 [Thermodesulfatator indicus DSM 15286]|uniref:Uncharacterized protein n=1 Tax=Thermodesulfatator indicus (strain DSM 15286 / JCM 11887 / CIR29812) TaxID=667014 RepID=F8AE10_THEID|nr:cytochrome c3 family protein [Thermodesulfatator indicus]AEH44980.1 hypothetical protein Thein_1109 [Thermodesulfatator indicus DSM 15286]
MRFLILLFLIVLFGCQAKESKPVLRSCKDCHHYELDEKHHFACTKCHQGRSSAATAKEAHQGLIASPASPSNWGRACGSCHAEKIKEMERSPHFTLVGVINPVLKAFDLPAVSSINGLPEPEKIKNRADLVYDLLRRRCLRCHLFYKGDDYPETRRGTGCAACHLLYGNGKLMDHTFIKTTPDRLCLHCHYGNRVGFDYYGLFEHDYPYAFRSPLIDGDLPPRPWGVEFHEMAQDVHLKAGLSCLSCHTGKELMAGGKGPACTDCHELDHKSPFHAKEVLAKVRCSACHAKFSFQDRGYYLMLQYDPDWEDWAEFYVQGSSEVENFIVRSAQGDELEPSMLDKISGKPRPGIWFLGFKERRFEDLPLGRDKTGKISIMRPLLDLHLSFVDEYGEVIFDNLTPYAVKKDPQKVYLPYSPHTIGQADYFRAQKILEMLHEDHHLEPQRR